MSTIHSHSFPIAAPNYLIMTNRQRSLFSSKQASLARSEAAVPMNGHYTAEVPPGTNDLHKFENFFRPYRNIIKHQGVPLNIWGRGSSETMTRELISTVSVSGTLRNRGHLDIGISGVWCPVSGFQYFGETEVFFL